MNRKLIMVVASLVVASLACGTQVPPYDKPVPLLPATETATTNPDPTATMQPTATTTPTPTRAPTCLVVTATTLHLRARPTESSQALDWFPTGTILQGELLEGNWWYVGRGYVHARYVEECQ